MSREGSRRAAAPRRRGFLKIAVILSVLHLVAAAGSFVLAFSIGIKRWDSGSPEILESTANAIAEVLLQPGIRFLSVGMPGELGNGQSLWGTASFGEPAVHYSCWQFAKRDEAVLPSNGVLWNDVFRLLRRLSGTARREH